MLTHAACAAHSMQIVNGVLSELELDNMIDVHGVEASCCQIGSYHNWELSIVEQLKCQLSTLHPRVLVVGK